MMLIGAALAGAKAWGADSSEPSKATTARSATRGERPGSEYPLNQPLVVTPLNFVRAETDRQFAVFVDDRGAFGKLYHAREVAPIDRQPVVRMNRDTIYSTGVFDLDAGPVTVTLPDPSTRFMSMQIINQDEYAPDALYGAGSHTLDRDTVGTRYAAIVIRTFVDPGNPADMAAAHALQDAIKVEQPGGPGKFEIPQWDKTSQDKVRGALLTLASTMSNFTSAFGEQDAVDPVAHVIGAAAGWGGNPARDAVYESITPTENDGRTTYRLHVEDVPVDGFWSITVYNTEGYMQPNPQNAYSVNNVTAATNPDGSVDIQFGGCDESTPNCLPTAPGWNYTVRLYRPHQEIIDSTWTFPNAEPLR
ncbi:DUF1214 domain-containing protein [Nocardia puris]|uniref:DUF1214 domain-containing protein n=2 Tax=Nocardia puris TaxID=208602 RepID=UPI001E5647BE|nr:DUF1214 domain-containing protein [Nocardia puris]